MINIIQRSYSLESLKHYLLAGGGYRRAVPGREEHGGPAAVQAGQLRGVQHGEWLGLKMSISSAVF